MMSEDKRYEVVVKEFGNGAHITVPKEWIGKITEVKVVGPYCPPLFSDVSEGKEVMMDIQTNEDELNCKNGLTDEIETVSGKVVEFKLNYSNDESTMKTEVIIDASSHFYRITVSRNAGDDGWSESEYSVERDLNTDEFNDTDRIISMEEGGMWKPVGKIDGFGVKQTV